MPMRSQRARSAMVISVHMFLLWTNPLKRMPRRSKKIKPTSHWVTTYRQAPLKGSSRNSKDKEEEYEDTKESNDKYDQPKDLKQGDRQVLLVEDPE